MGVYVIGDKDTVLGFTLVGGYGVVVQSAREAREHLESALEREEIDLLLVTREWADSMRERMNRLLMTSLRPVIIEIPGKESRPSVASIDDLVRRAIGMSL
jgi:V/A-type H+-transporting ATPase subunit F